MHSERKGVRICERNNYTDTKLSEKGEGVLQASEVGFLCSPWRTPMLGYAPGKDLWAPGERDPC